MSHREYGSMGMEMQFSQQPLQEQVLAWKMSPLAQMQRIEVLDSALIRSSGKLRSYQHQYKRERGDILEPPFDEATFIATIGKSGIGKGSVAMGIYRLLKHDEYLRDEAAKRGITLDIVVVPFALYQAATVLERVKKRLPALQTATFGQLEHYAAIAQLEWEDIERYVITPQPKTKRIALIESASYTSFPTGFTTPVSVHGIDRGNSPVYNLALDNRTRKRTFLNIVEQDETVAANTKDARLIEPATMSDAAIRAYFNADVTYIFTSGNAEVDVRELTIEQQREILQFLTITRAKPEKMDESNRQLRNLHEFYNVHTDHEWHKILTAHLGYEENDRRLARIVNKHLQGEKTIDLDYFKESLPARLYPEILPAVLKAA